MDDCRQDCTVKIGDFGLSRAIGGASQGLSGLDQQVVTGITAIISRCRMLLVKVAAGYR